MISKYALCDGEIILREVVGCRDRVEDVIGLLLRGPRSVQSGAVCGMDVAMHADCDRRGNPQEVKFRPYFSRTPIDEILSRLATGSVSELGGLAPQIKPSIAVLEEYTLHHLDEAT